MTNLFQFLVDQAVQFFRHHRDALLAISQDTMTGARKPSRKQKHNWPVNDEVQAILAVWLVARSGAC